MSDETDLELQKQTDARFDAALAENVATIYANGFVIRLSSGDIGMGIERNGKPVAIVNMSFTVAKSLAFSLAQVIAQLEDMTGREMLTTNELDSLVKKYFERREGKP